MLRNNEAKRQLGYTDPKSIVRFDGSEVLHGKDWTRRKRELLKRSGGKCERLSVLGEDHHPSCRGIGEEPHHIIKRSQRRDDRLSNLANLSHWCHDDQDSRKPMWTKRHQKREWPGVATL